jgi:hypothetical protein
MHVAKYVNIQLPTQWVTIAAAVGAARHQINKEAAGAAPYGIPTAAFTNMPALFDREAG